MTVLSVVSVCFLHILSSKTVVNIEKSGWDRTRCSPVDSVGM